MEDRVVRLCVFDSTFEGEAIRDALEKEGIHVSVGTFDDSAYDGVFIPQRGAGQILVFEKELEKARAVLAEWKSRKPD